MFLRLIAAPALSTIMKNIRIKFHLIECFIVY